MVQNCSICLSSVGGSSVEQHLLFIWDWQHFTALVDHSAYNVQGASRASGDQTQ